MARPSHGFYTMFLKGTALSWYIRSNDTYKQDWHAFVQAYKKQFSSQKKHTMLKMKPLTYQKRTMKQYVILHLKFNSWLINAGVMRMHLLLFLNVMKFLPKGLPKNLKDFANKRQVKHTSTVLEPSILFHTLVKLVDAEDITNDKIRT